MTGNTKDVKQLTRSPYHLLKRAAQYAAHIYMGEVGKSGLTQRQFTVLLAVDQNDGISQTALVKMTGIDRSTLADLAHLRLVASALDDPPHDRGTGSLNHGYTVSLLPIPGESRALAPPYKDDRDRRVALHKPAS